MTDKSPTKEQIDAHAYYCGLHAALINAAAVRNALDDLIADLRGKGDYLMSDQLRLLSNRLDRSLIYPCPHLARGKFTKRPAEVFL